jgi:hypothetical protein
MSTRLRKSERFSLRALERAEELGLIQARTTFTCIGSIEAYSC